MADEAHQTWQEKINFLETQLAQTADAEQKFSVNKKIEEAKKKLAELSGQPRLPEAEAELSDGIERLVDDLKAVKQKRKSTRKTADLILQTSNDVRWKRLELSDAYRRDVLEGMMVSVNLAIVANDRAFAGGEKVKHAREAVKALVKLAAGLLEQESTASSQYLQALCNAALRYMNEPIRIDSDNADKLHLRASSNKEKELDELLQDIFST